MGLPDMLSEKVSESEKVEQKSGRRNAVEGRVPSFSPISNFRTLADHLRNTPCIQGLTVKY